MMLLLMKSRLPALGAVNEVEKLQKYWSFSVPFHAAIYNGSDVSYQEIPSSLHLLYGTSSTGVNLRFSIFKSLKEKKTTVYMIAAATRKEIAPTCV